MQDYALLNTCCIFKYERFCNLQCLLHLNFWIYFLKNMVLHMKMCKSLHIAHFEYATLQYIVPHFGSLFCTLWIFQCAKSCTLQCNISKVPILTLYGDFEGNNTTISNSSSGKVFGNRIEKNRVKQKIEVSHNQPNIRTFMKIRKSMNGIPNQDRGIDY